MTIAYESVGSGWAEISDCGTYRYTLERRWATGNGRVCWIMLNPSTADSSRDDPTVRRCIQFSRAWGYRELVIVNLYPFRSSSPAECRLWSNWESRSDWWGRDQIFFRNLPIVVEQAKSANLVVCAWGAGLWDPAFADHVAEEIQSNDEPWPALYCLGHTRNRDPIHPMARGTNRVPDSQQPILWRAALQENSRESDAD